MKKTLTLDAKLLDEARTASGASTDTEAVRLGLEALVRHEDEIICKQLLGVCGMEGMV